MVVVVVVVAVGVEAVAHIAWIIQNIIKKFQKNTRSDMKIQKYSSIQIFLYSCIVFKF